MTMLYTILDGQSIRVPIDLRSRVIDWSKMEPYNEPPLVTQFVPRIRREFQTPEHKRQLCRERIKKWRKAQAQKSAGRRSQ